MSSTPENDLEATLIAVRFLADAKEIRITQHAQQEMTEEAISLDDVLQTITTEMAFAHTAEQRTMNCSMKDCTGHYEMKTVIHTVRTGGRVVVIDHVPAEVCTVCGDILFTPQTVSHIEDLLANLPSPAATVPLFEYA
jgi:YgiT-type zinc finger domain-containing protein